MPFNLETCRFCVWGFRDSNNSFKYIHEAFFRALQHLGKNVRWLDDTGSLSESDFENILFISMNSAVVGMPRRHDCMYVVHNIEAQAKEYLAGYKLLNYGLYVSTMSLPNNAVELSRDTYYFPQPWEAYDSAVFRWGTNLLPLEIEANKPTRVFNSSSNVINYIGCSATEWTEAVKPFGQAAWENGVVLRHLSGVSHEDSVRLIKESYMAPAINIQYQTGVGYVPCRVFKAISAGQMPVTNNLHVYEFFKDGVYDSNPRDLFFAAKEYLPSVKLDRLHNLMDDVARNHTYLNKIDAILKSVKMSLESREAK